jgi:hypothetical protein
MVDAPFSIGGTISHRRIQEQLGGCMGLVSGGHGGMKEQRRLKLSGIQVGVTGEYLVAAELSRRGYVATLTLRNTRGIDILASNSDATQSVGIQVKTAQSVKPNWMMNKKAEADVAEHLFYVFVCLASEGSATFYVVPRKVVAKHVRESHAKWLKTPGRKGQAHKDTDMRRYKDPAHKYKDRWDLLGLG